MKIQTINYASLPSALWSNLTELDLSDNPYVCDCRLAWFRRWLIHKKGKINVLRFNDSSAYTCSYPLEDAGRSITGRLSQLDGMKCFENSVDVYLMIQLTCFILIVLVSSLGSLLHRYRWHIRYWIMQVICYITFADISCSI